MKLVMGEINTELQSENLKRNTYFGGGGRRDGDGKILNKS
jgi:hypothetical protein